MARSIRPLELGDVEQVASLYEHVARSGSRTPPPGLVDYFVRMFLEPPNADLEIPSLVFVEPNGKVAGFMGSSVRPMRFEGEQIRAGICGQLVTEPRARRQAVGAFLIREYLLGRQELTITDTASETVRRIWEGLGGETSQLACIGWVRVFRPFTFAGDYLERGERFAKLARRARPLFGPLDRLAVRVRRAGILPDSPDWAADPLTPQGLTALMSSVGESVGLRPDYDEEFVAWLLDEVAAVQTRGQLVARIVRRNGVVRGSYVYYLPTRGIVQVLQVAARERDVGDVLDDLFYDAWTRGASAVQGRVEGHLREPLSKRRCLFHASGYLALIHASNPEILNAIQAGKALLTRLEGEWWMGHHLEPFTTREARRPVAR